LSVHVVANKMCVRYVVFSNNFYGLTFNTTTSICLKKTRKVAINSPTVSALSVMRNIVTTYRLWFQYRFETHGSNLSSMDQRYKHRPPSWILLDFIFRPPTKSTWWPEAMFKIFCRSDLYFRRYCDWNFRKYGLKYYSGPKIGGFGGFRPLNISGYHRDPQKALSCAEPRILTYRSSKSVNRGDLQARWRNEKKTRKSQTRMRPHHPRRPTSPIFGS